MKKLLLLLFILCLVPAKSQVFTYLIAPAQMSGPPGSTFNYNITFTNPTASPITVAFHRYQKYNPPYWYSCFCYIQCNPPDLDSLNIYLPANSSSMVTVLFKTDSVNPGTATSSIRFYEQSFQNNADTIHITATTQGPTGLTESSNSSNAVCFPNPTIDNFIFEASENSNYNLFLIDNSGKLILNIKSIQNKKYIIKMEDQPPGIYILTAVYNSGRTESKKIIKH